MVAQALACVREAFGINGSQASLQWVSLISVGQFETIRSAYL